MVQTGYDFNAQANILYGVLCGERQKGKENDKGQQLKGHLLTTAL